MTMRHLAGLRRNGGRLLALAAVALVAAACTTPDLRFAEGPADGRNYRERHPITLDRTSASLTLPATAKDAALTEAERSRLDAFLARFGARGRGRILVVVPGNAPDRAAVMARGEAIARHASEQARGSDVTLSLDPSDGGNQISVHYNIYTVRAMNCRDWSKESSHDPSNQPHPDLGCSLQRSLGLMVANPADLAAPRTADSRDAQRSNLVVQRYRAGKPTVAESDSKEQTTISDVANQ